MTRAATEAASVKANKNFIFDNAIGQLSCETPLLSGSAQLQRGGDRADGLLGLAWLTTEE